MRAAGLVARSTPSRMIGPLPAFTSSVKIRSITSSLSAPPTTGLVWTTLAGGALDLEEGTLLRVGLADVDDEVVGEHELGQRVGAVPSAGQSVLPSRPSQKARLAFSRARYAPW